ncbi:MAG: YbhB/YbcL family Raf kinase inhibitor-like protein [Desulfobacula sp.]|uniref:YbhB/YbcL family Raf kinase inhibitor-like protein n=1 Tax=Desulfobacula sp. TaxID=2593537 RepID=UPI001ED5C811|nr:YbhB/YbcL family Raf kinase inhibitor-like protein [Desulfobacula sp.]
MRKSIVLVVSFAFHHITMCKFLIHDILILKLGGKMLKNFIASLMLIVLSIFAGIIFANAEVVVDANLGLSIPCVNVNGSFFQCDLTKYDNSADLAGLYWQLSGNVLAASDDGDCASVDTNFMFTLPSVDVNGSKYLVTLNYYPNSLDPNGHYWAFGSAIPKTNTVFSLSSQDFTNNGIIPLQNACISKGGSNISPQLSWKNPPQGTAGFALIMDDEDSPCGTGDNACKHWSVFNIPSSVNSFQANLDISSITGLTEGENWEGNIGYAGPCPPDKHTYTFTIYALDSVIPAISSGVPMTRSQFANAYAPYIIDSATMKGTFTP